MHSSLKPQTLCFPPAVSGSILIAAFSPPSVSSSKYHFMSANIFMLENNFTSKIYRMPEKLLNVREYLSEKLFHVRQYSFENPLHAEKRFHFRKTISCSKNHFKFEKLFNVRKSLACPKNDSMQEKPYTVQCIHYIRIPSEP